MPLRLMKRAGRGVYYLRGTVMGVRVYKTTGTADATLAEALRIKTESRILHEAVYGKKAVVTFDDAVRSYLETGAPARFHGTTASPLNSRAARTRQPCLRP